MPLQKGIIVWERMIKVIFQIALATKPAKKLIGFFKVVNGV